MKKKSLSTLKLKKSKISSLNLSNQLGGYNSGETTTFTTDASETNPNYTITCYTLYCGETETCETGCGGCNTNDTTRSQQSPSLQVACNALGSILGC
ncbi:hypothetical protein [uncultured Kordia sp.]|uniref:hypothetical protein n=1 Tax=uncultured Kordia sp. TaxID=507699 RepID=UPI002625B2BF|nr:hypothetical protein [uncultured Kordia sp.]